MRPNGDIVLRADGLRMRYGTTDVLEGVTFEARRGEVLAMLGPNGAGKTTTIEILEGFRRRSAGRVEVLGADPAHGDEDWRARVGIVLQSWRDHGRWRVRELLAHLGTYYAGHSTPEVRRPWNAAELIGVVGLGAHADKQVRMLSGGQRRRLDVAIGMVGRPELLFLDEPTAGFDPQARREFHELIAELSAEGATTIMLTTHDLAEAEKLADRIVILDRGRIIADGTADELAEQIVGEDEVHWTLDGQRYVRSTKDSTRFVHDLFKKHGDDISGLAVRPSSLEDTYLALVHRAESGEEIRAAGDEADAKEPVR
ncbi:ABC transporter ATP-binding protein [Actinomadura sp. NAK00032]|uniref:ABC transporter ATP-binding protein n=1 Tax=Actinomadura sp. NAK00032 TaxID=2742128 RepID=UPI001591A3C7|nr:ABC transporter ATP-binding protein [Actinomadura sp. NAK00032]QKW35633.1 ABC transporter ATP-binding protein [Actinomadura sp. NAK00032]